MKSLGESASAVLEFLKEATKAAVDHITKFVKGVWEHIEGITVVTLSAFGLSNLLGEAPFYATLPAWVELPLVVPILSVLIVSMLLKSAEWRAKRRTTTQVVVLPT